MTYDPMDAADFQPGLLTARGASAPEANARGQG